MASKVRCYDGALLKISIDGGVTWSQAPDDKLLNDEYDGTILAHLGNPLAGRKAWCTRGGGWLDVEVDLDEYAGQMVTLRFRFGTASSVRSTWYVDKVRVQACRNVYAYPLYLPLVFK